MAVALIGRVAVVVATPHYKPIGDPADYDVHATSIADGHGYPDTKAAKPGTPSAIRPPAYPYLLASTYVLEGDHAWKAARLLEAALGVLTVLLLYLIAREVAGDRVALLAAGIGAVYPSMLAVNGSLISEALFVPLELAALFVILLYKRRPELRWALACGAVCGLAALTRTLGILLLVPAVVVLWRATAARRAIPPLLAVVAAAMVIAPWTARNAGAFDAFVPISTQGGLTAIGTYNSVANSPGPEYTHWHQPDYLPGLRSLFHNRLDEAELDARLRRKARSYALDHPGYVAAVIARNSLRTIDVGPQPANTTNPHYSEMGVPGSLRVVLSIGLWVILLLAVVGVAYARRSQLRHHFIWAFPVLAWVSTVAINAGARYRAPVEPFLVLLAAVGVTALWGALGARGGAALLPSD